MSEVFSLVGKSIKLYIDGEWEFSGIVEYEDRKRIVLKKEDGSLVIYRSHVTAVMIVEEIQSKRTIVHKSGSRYDNSVMTTTPVPKEGQAIQQESYYGSIIPADMLVGDDDNQQVDFIMSMQDLRNEEVRGEISYGSREEDELDKEEIEG